MTPGETIAAARLVNAFTSASKATPGVTPRAVISAVATLMEAILKTCPPEQRRENAEALIKRVLDVAGMGEGR